ncbi:MAG: GntR family transcriptional regulator [Ignavibacteria bacterium]|nr:GntR family transcriptional regulator [Ignavibacteria bacterium]
MKFNDTQPIFVQIADWIYERILVRYWSAGERIPSVRDLAIELEVNPNTVMRTYDRLQSAEVIYNKRGVGYFLSDRAFELVLNIRRAEFINTELPVLIKNLHLLGLTPIDVEKAFNQYINQKMK